MYIAYLTNQMQTNASPTHAGGGSTKELALKASTYYANQHPWVKLVPFSRAPKWAQQETKEAAMWHLHNFSIGLDFGTPIQSEIEFVLDQIKVLEKFWLYPAEAKDVLVIKQEIERNPSCKIS